MILGLEANEAEPPLTELQLLLFTVQSFDLLHQVHMLQLEHELPLSLREHNFEKSLQVPMIPDEADDVHLFDYVVKACQEELVPLIPLSQQFSAATPTEQVVCNGITHSVGGLILILLGPQDLTECFVEAFTGLWLFLLIV